VQRGEQCHRANHHKGHALENTQRAWVQEINVLNIQPVTK
jgi:hypothetical protein